MSIKPLFIQHAAQTSPGHYKTQNEDAYGVFEELDLFVLADGMGGHAGGKIASSWAIQLIFEFYQKTKLAPVDELCPPVPNCSEEENQLRCALQVANHHIFQCAETIPGYKGMGTTLVVVLIKNQKIYIAHVGDSRVYRIRNGYIEALTQDHSLLEDYKRIYPHLSRAEENQFPLRHIVTRALGLEATLQPEVRIETIQPEDRFLICSDGLNRMIPDEEILSLVLQAGFDLQQGVADLVAAANNQGGLDNITVVLMQCLSPPVLG